MVGLKKLKNESGFAIMESIFFLFAFVILTVYVIDTFTTVHTGIVNSMAARAYTFETLEHRSNVAMYREDGSNTQNNPNYAAFAEHRRFQTVTDENQELGDTSGYHAAARRFTQAKQDDGNNHTPVSSTTLDDSKMETATIFIKTGYGICIDAQCARN